MSDRKTVKDIIKDVVSDLLYYDRKEEEDLGVGDIEILIDTGKLTEKEIVQWFKEALKEGLE